MIILSSVITSQQQRQADTKEETRSTKVFVNVDYSDYGTYHVKIWVRSPYGYDYKIFTAIVDKYYYEIKHPPGPAKTGPFFIGNNIPVGEHFQACIENLSNMRYRCITGSVNHTPEEQIPEYVSLALP
jgi:PKD repeat protein